MSNKIILRLEQRYRSLATQDGSQLLGPTQTSHCILRPSNSFATSALTVKIATIWAPSLRAAGER
jgi:hypothetical protein